MQSPKPFRVERPWGDYLEFTRNISSTVKIITVKAGEAFSLQQHTKRDEFWHIISGTGTITIGEEKVPIVASKDYFLPMMTAHRVEAGSEPVVFLEIALGTALEEDIIRIEDRYGRT